jgi:hypothetical protein
MRRISWSPGRTEKSLPSQALILYWAVEAPWSPASTRVAIAAAFALRDLPFPAAAPTDLQAVVGRRIIEVSLRTHESPAARLYVFRCDDSW